ncbi:Na-Ca exchanger/integrin-beta4 [Tolypothrix sp. NIES-4075]|uniref:DUF4114 domain-containing protein n=1 Tax=Tolypothrix sp. NIES-4075 TaxID=2005459 RepID=UPI000B5CBBAC|nr:DUF4114 domain-containing protein [Tolypothrix sp. NIES-4075]GAX40857.1 Na-Ca exchanger/integrin-beta4 [Tolypothrix sp. NIES-4075]
MTDKDTNDLSIEASINKLSFKDSNGLSNIFALSGSSSSSTSVQFSLSQRKAAFINEIGVFVVSDDKGTVNGIAPGTQGYMQAAFSTSRVIFSSLSEKASAGINFARQLTFKAGERLGFYLVANNTTSSVDTQMTSGKTSDNVFFSLSSCNTDKFDHVRVKDKGKSTFDLAWEDLKGGGDKDFNDLVLKMEIVKTPPALGIGLQGQKEGEILDFRGVKGQISANFTVNSDSSNRNHVGFYRINDTQGSVTDPLTGKTITPGEVGYAQAAIRQSIVNFNQSSTSSTSIEGGGLFATYIIANGTSEQFLNLNQNNQQGSGPVAYFTFHKANPDKVQHIRQFGDNTFGFEEPSIKGKREYSYTVFKVDLSVKAEIDNGSDDALVNISATNPTATETDSATNTGTFRISRSGDTSAELIVNLGIDSSSTVTSNDGGAFAIDYSLTGGNIYGTGATRSVIIPVGMSFVDITLTAIDDTHAEASEILKLNLAAGNYRIDTTKNNATVTIAANDTGVINTYDDATGTDYTKREGSLRQALINANAFMGTDDITFNIPTTDAGYTAATGMYTITLASALDNISDDVNITGLGANKLTVSGNNAVRVFSINEDVKVKIDALTIAKGKANEGGGIYNDGTLTLTNSTIIGNSASGTGLYVSDIDGLGGGIYNEGTLTVINSTISGNSADYTGNGVGGYGGGIYNEGSLTVTNSTISDNKAKLTSGKYGGDGGGIYNYNYDVTLMLTNVTLSGNSAIDGGGIYNYGDLTVSNSTLSGNSAIDGAGGIYNEYGITTVTNSTLSDNSAQQDGGGILNGGTLMLTNVTLSGNSTNYYGGGIYNYGTTTVTNSTLSGNSTIDSGGGIYNYGTTIVTNSTLSGNSAQQEGGGIYNEVGTTTVTNSTLSGNSAQQEGGGIYNEIDTVKAKNTIIANNTANSNPDFDGTLTSDGYNLIGNTSGTTITGNTTGNILNVNPKLDTLKDNGGPTYTMALLTGSPAINAGDSASAPTTDQRGTDRIKNNKIDIGAYESNLNPPLA